MDWLTSLIKTSTVYFPYFNSLAYITHWGLLLVSLDVELYNVLLVKKINTSNYFGRIIIVQIIHFFQFYQTPYTFSGRNILQIELKYTHHNSFLEMRSYSLKLCKQGYLK